MLHVCAAIAEHAQGVSNATHWLNLYRNSRACGGILHLVGTSADVV